MALIKGLSKTFFMGLVFFPAILAAEPIAEVKQSKLPVPMEDWAKHSKVFSGELTQENCLGIQPDAAVKMFEKKVWMSGAQGHKGLLVIQPLTPASPGLIIFPVSSNDAGKILVITARGSDTKPGGKMVIKNGETVLHESQIDNEWVELSATIPPDTKEIRIEWHAIDWAWEMLWIDEIRLKDAPLPGAAG